MLFSITVFYNARSNVLILNRGPFQECIGLLRSERLTIGFQDSLTVADLSSYDAAIVVSHCLIVSKLLISIRFVNIQIWYLVLPFLSLALIELKYVLRFI